MLHRPLAGFGEEREWGTEGRETAREGKRGKGRRGKWGRERKGREGEERERECKKNQNLAKPCAL